MYSKCATIAKQLIFIRLIIGVTFLLISIKAFSQPCLPGWNYRVPVTINNSAGVTHSNFQVSFIINTQQLIVDSKLKLDGSDIRMLTNSGVVIPHWIEPVTFNSLNTKVWVKVPSIPLGTSTIYLFYGNPAASDISSGDMTFSFFDDFKEAGVNSSKWNSCNGGSFSVDDEKLTLTSTNDTDEKAILRSVPNFSGAVTAEMYVNNVTNGGSYIGFQKITDENGYGLFYDQTFPSNLRMVLFQDDPNCLNISNQSSVGAVNSGTTTGIWRMTWSANAEQYIDWPGAGLHPIGRSDGAYPFSSSTKTWLVVGHSWYNGSVTLDWVRVRKHHNIEPVANIGTEVSLSNTAIAGSNAPICEGSDLQLTANTVNGADYNWTGPNGFSFNGQNPTINSALPAASGEYTLTITVPTGCAPAISKIMVTVYQQTNAGTLSGGGAVCQGSNTGTLNLNGNIGQPLRWESSSTGFAPWTTISSTDLSLAYTNLDKTTYFRTAVKNGVCPLQYTVPELVEVAPAAKGGSIIGPLPICTGINSGTMELIGQVGNIVEWQSSIDNWITYTPIANTTTSYSFTNLLITTQFRVLIKSGSCPTAFSVPFIMTVHPNPVPDFNADPVCDLTPMVFHNNSTISIGQIASYLWDFGDGTNSIDVDPSHLFLNPGTYDVNLKATSTYGCSASTTKQVIINEQPIANFTADNVCFGNPVEFLNSSTISSGSMTYKWDFGDGTTSILFSPDHQYAIAGTYNVILKATSGAGCENSLTKIIEVFPSPIVNAGNDTTISRGFGVMLQATGGTNYTWTPNEGLNNSNISNPIVNPENTTTYTVFVTDEHGCEGSDDIVVTVKKDFLVIISNVLTPDGNGSNDTWKIFNIESFVNESHVEVFNRWGKSVFSQKGYRNDWEGVDGTDILPDGVYYYVVFFEGTDKIYKGAITILRNKK